MEALIDRELVSDIGYGLSKKKKEIPPRYFYDELGSELFEEITSLPEYYQTRTEEGIIKQIVPLLTEEGFEEVIEFGSGSSKKTRTILDRLTSDQTLRRYVPIDVSGPFLVNVATELGSHYAELNVEPFVGLFDQALESISRTGPALLLFLGGTIGNLSAEEAGRFLSYVKLHMHSKDKFLVGVDLVKDPKRLHAAYNDSSGTTARFNKNILNVLNRELGADFEPTKFHHYAFWNPNFSRIEMHLVSREQQQVHLADLGQVVQFKEGESILTEISRKFTPNSAREMVEGAGFSLDAIWTDPEHDFGLLFLSVQELNL